MSELRARGRGRTAPVRNDRRSQGGRGPTLVFATMVFLGLLIASYPGITQWVSAFGRADAITGFTTSLDGVGNAAAKRILEAAREYNARMPDVLVSDPYTLDDARNGAGGAWERYLDQLTLPDTDVMATVRIPSLGVRVPVRHGTADDVLSEGAGHIFGSSLPVGGERTHSVITAHTAYTAARLFDDLGKMRMGDTFAIDVAGETLTYRVDSIETVLPNEVGSLQLEEGRDLVTLVTCTPAGLNTHRLLVRGERVPDDEVQNEGTVENRASADTGFQWWMLWLGLAAVGLTVVVIKTPKRERPAAENDAAG